MENQELVKLIYDGNFLDALSMIEKENNDKNLKLYKLEIYYLKGEYNKLLEEASSFLENYDLKEEVTLMAQYWYAWGFIKKSEHFRAEKILMAAFGKFNSLSKYKKRNYKNISARLYDALGSNYLEYGNADEAVENLLKALEIYLSLNDPYGTILAYNNIAVAYKRLGNLTKSMEYFQLALKSLKMYPMKSYEAAIIANVGEIYRLKGSFEKAEMSQSKSLMYVVEIGNKARESQIRRNIAMIYFDERVYNTALEYMEGSVNLLSKFDDPSLESQILFDYGLILLKLGKDIQWIIDELSKFFQNTKNKLVRYRYRLLYSIWKKSFNRMENKVEAQKNLRKLIGKTNNMDFELTYITYINYIELLFFELQIVNNSEIITEIKEKIKRLKNLNRGNEAYTKQIEVLLINSKLSELELDFKTAMTFLVQAEFLIMERSLHGYTNEIEDLKNSINQNQEKSNELIILSYAERMKLFGYNQFTN